MKIAVVVATVGPSAAQDLDAQIEATIASCGVSYPNEPSIWSAKEKNRLTECLKGQADDGSLYPNSLIFTFAKLLEETGRKQEALEYMAFAMAAMSIDLGGCPPELGFGAPDVIMMKFGKVENDPSMTLDMKREAVRGALALEAATAKMRAHRAPSACLEYGGQKSPEDASKSEAGWWQRRAVILKTLEPTLLVIVGVRPGLSPKPK